MVAIAFNPSPLTTADIIIALTDPEQSLRDIAKAHKTTVVELAAWLARPDIQHRITLIEAAIACRNRLIAATHLPQAVRAATTIITAFNSRSPAPFDRQASETARRASALLLRLSSPLPGAGRAREGWAKSATSADPSRSLTKSDPFPEAVFATSPVATSQAAPNIPDPEIPTSDFPSPEFSSSEIPSSEIPSSEISDFKFEISPSSPLPLPFLSSSTPLSSPSLDHLAALTTFSPFPTDLSSGLSTSSLHHLASASP